MEDYGSLFGGGNAFVEDPRFAQFATDPSLTPGAAPSARSSLNALLTNPAMQTVVLNFAKALDPKGFGGRLAESTLQMRQALSKAKGLGNTTQPPVPAVAPPAANAGTPPAATEDHPVVTQGKHLATLGSMLQKSFDVDPSLVPSGYMNSLSTALSANPKIENPTQPGSAPIGQALAGAPPVQYNEVPEALAMSMTPEQVQDIYTHKLNVQKTGDATREMNLREQAAPGERVLTDARTEHLKWEIDPARVEEQIRVNTAPVLAQLDVYKGKQQFDTNMAKDFNSKFPQLAATKIPYSNMTYGQAVSMAAYNGDASKNVAQLINAGLDYKAAMARTSADITIAREHAAATGTEMDFNKKMLLYEKFNQDLLKYSKAMPLEEWNKKTTQEQQTLTVLGIVPRTKEVEAAIQTAQQSRDYLGNLLMPRTYGGLKSAEGKFLSPDGKPLGYGNAAPGSTVPPFDIALPPGASPEKAAKRIVADPTKLQELDRRIPTYGGSEKTRTKKKVTYSAPTFSIPGMFNYNPNEGK